MSKQPTSVRLPDLTTRQLADLISTTGMTQSEIVSTAIDRMYQQEITMTSKHETHRQQLIGKIASTIYGYRMSEDAIAKRNKAGWTIDIRFSDGQYIGESNWSRVEDIHLDSSELDEVRRIVAAFEKNPWRDPEQIVKEVRAISKIAE